MFRIKVEFYLFVFGAGIETRKIREQGLIGLGITSQRDGQDYQYGSLLQRSVQRHRCPKST